MPRRLNTGPQGVNRQLFRTIVSGQGRGQFNHGVGANDREGIDLATEAFLTYPHPALALNLLRVLLDIHQKGGTFAPLLAELSHTERSLFAEHHRDHVVHTSLVYCVGLYLYLTFGHLRQAMHRQLLKSLNRHGETEGSAIGEFSFQWRLASLLHDLAYPFQIYQGGRHSFDLGRCLSHVNYFLSRMPRYCGHPPDIELDASNYFDKLNGLFFMETDATQLMESTLHIRPLGVKEYATRLYETEGRVDHGIMGAVLLCKLVDMLYDFHAALGTRSILGVLWDRRFLRLSVAHGAAAVAFHSIDHTSTVLSGREQQSLVQLNSEDMLIGLLRVSDVLQEWDRPPSDGSRVTHFLPNTAFDFVPSRRSKTLQVNVNASDTDKNRLRHELEAAARFPIRIAVR